MTAIGIPNLIKYIALSVLIVGCLSACKKEKVDPVIQELTPSAYNLYHLFFLNDSVGYVCGGDRYNVGVILRTQDGGNSWSAQDSVIPKAAYSMFFFNEQEGFVGGFDAWLAHTMDSGQHYDAHTLVSYQPALDMQFINHQQGLIVNGSGFSIGVIAHTNDGGQHWAETNYTNSLNCIKYVDSTTVFVGGYGVIYKSTNAGASFIPLEVSGDFYVDCDFTSTTIGYFAGYEGSIIKTTDGGLTFNTVMHGNSPFGGRDHFQAIQFWDANTGFVVGEAGIMYETTDAGANWKQVQSFTSTNLRDIHLFSATSGIICGEEGKVFLFHQ